MKLSTLPNGSKALFIGKLKVMLTKHWDFSYQASNDKAFPVKFWLNLGFIELKVKN